MPLIFLFLALILTSCGRAEKGTVNPVFKPYADRFVELSKREGYEWTESQAQYISIQFDDSGYLERNNYLGYCRRQDGKKSIGISREYWESKYVDFADKESLIFHELGHCLLGRPHEEEEVPAVDVKFMQYSLPVSLMNPYAVDGLIYGMNYEDYLQELFLGVKAKQLYFYAASSFPAHAYTALSSLAPSAEPDLAVNAKEAQAFKQRFRHRCK